MRSLYARRQQYQSVGANLVGYGYRVGDAAAMPAAAVPLTGAMPYSGSTPSWTPSQPTQLRKWLLGFGSATVSASGTANLTTQPQTWFRPDRLSIPSSQAPFFLITDIKIGNKSQLLNVNAINAQMFIETAVDSMVTFDTADPAVTITISVSNTDTTASHTIVPTMIGASAY
jgi:hypothetical protein